MPNPNKTTKPNLSSDKGIRESALGIGGIKKDTAVIKTDIAMAYQIQGLIIIPFG